MSDHESINNELPLLGKSAKLCVFTEAHINNEYIEWLNDFHVVRYSNQRFKKHDFNSCREYFQSFKNTDNLFLAIHINDNNKFVGTMTAYYSHPHNVVDLGLMIGDRDYWGKGVGQDVWQMLMAYMLETKKVRKVTGGTLSSNLGMVNIMKKAGMQSDGERVKHELVNGYPVDILHFSKFSNN
jgi:RimJ/RimL family protein N-acetyltransferase|tara:strand:- start:513 stop:1061 length:549 start_codon:yes stop_codon:yes gene_type:complete